MELFSSRKKYLFTGKRITLATCCEEIFYRADVVTHNRAKECLPDSQLQRQRCCRARAFFQIRRKYFLFLKRAGLPMAQ
jgi:hypothetical protein